MSSTIGSGSLESGSEGSGDEDEQSVDSEPEQSSDEETAATQTRPAAPPEPAAPMDLSVIRELSERMDASLARLLLRYPPTYSVDPGIDSALEGYGGGNGDRDGASEGGDNGGYRGNENRMNRNGTNGGGGSGGGGSRGNAGYSSRQHAVDKGNTEESEKLAALEVINLNTAKSRAYDHNFGGHAKSIIGNCAPLLPNRAEVLVAHAVAAWTTLPDTFDGAASDLKKRIRHGDQKQELPAGDVLALAPDPMDLPFIRPPGAQTRGGDWNRRLLVLAKGVRPPPPRPKNKAIVNELTENGRALNAVREDAVDEQLAGHLDEIDELKRRLASMENALQTQQQKIETESELNAFLDRRSYDVKDLRDQLSKHEAALEEARRTGEAGSVAQSIKQAEIRIEQLERERNSGGESVAGQAALDSRIGRLEESATGALQEQLSKTTRARDQAEETLSELRVQMQGLQTAGLQQPLVEELERLKAERAALLETIGRLKTGNEEESALRLQKLEAELNVLQQQSPRSGAVGEILSGLRNEIQSVQGQQAKLVAAAAHQGSQSSLSADIDADVLAQQLMGDSRVRGALQELRRGGGSKSALGGKQGALQAILAAAARASSTGELDRLKQEQQPGPVASATFRQHLLDSISREFRQQRIAAINTTALLDEPTIQQCLHSVENEGTAGGGVGGVIRQMARLAGITGALEIDETVEDMVLAAGVQASASALREHGDRRRRRLVALERIFVGALRTHRLRQLDTGHFIRGKTEEQRRADAQQASASLEQRADVCSALQNFEDCHRYLSSDDGAARADAEAARQHAVATVIHASDTPLGSIAASSGGETGAARAFVDISEAENIDAEDRAKGLLLEDKEVVHTMNQLRPVKGLASNDFGSRGTAALPAFGGLDGRADDVEGTGGIGENGVTEGEPGPATSAALRQYLVAAAKSPFEDQRAAAHQLESQPIPLPPGPQIEWGNDPALNEALDAIEGGIEPSEGGDAQTDQDRDLSNSISTLARVMGRYYKNILSPSAIVSATAEAKRDSNLCAIADALREHGSRRNRRIAALSGILAAVRRSEPPNGTGLLPGHLASSSGLDRGRIDDEAILDLEGRPEVCDALSSLEQVDSRGMAGRAVAGQQRLATVAVLLRALEEGSHDEEGFVRTRPRKSAAEIDRRARAILQQSSEVVTILGRLKPISPEKWRKARGALRMVSSVVREANFQEAEATETGQAASSGAIDNGQPSNAMSTRLRRYLVEAVQFALRERADLTGESQIDVEGDPVLAEALDAVEASWREGGSRGDGVDALSAALSDVVRRVALQMEWGDLTASRESAAVLKDISSDTNVLAVAGALAEHGQRWTRRVMALEAIVAASDRERIGAGRPNGSRGQIAMEPSVISQIASSLAQSDGAVRRALVTLEDAEERSKIGTSPSRAALEEARLNLVSAVMRAMEEVVALEASASEDGAAINWPSIVANAAKSNDSGNGPVHVGENELAMRAKELLKRDAPVQDSLHGFKPRSEATWKRVMVLRRLLPGIRAVDAAAGDVVSDRIDDENQGFPLSVSSPPAANTDIDVDLLASDERVEEALRALSSIEKEEAEELATQAGDRPDEHQSPGSRGATESNRSAQDRSQRRHEAFRVILKAAKTRALRPAPSYSTLGGYPAGEAGDLTFEDDIDDDAGEHLSVSDALARLGVGIPSKSPFSASRGGDGRTIPLNHLNNLNEHDTLDFGSPRSHYDRSVGMATGNSQPLSLEATKTRVPSRSNDNNIGWLRDFYSNTPNVVHHLDEATHHNRVLHAVDLIHGAT